MKKLLLFALFIFVSYIKFAKFEAASELNKAHSGLDDSSSGFTEGSFHPEHSITSGQSEIRSDSIKFTSDLSKDSSSSGEPTSCPLKIIQNFQDKS